MLKKIFFAQKKSDTYQRDKQLLQRNDASNFAVERKEEVLPWWSMHLRSWWVPTSWQAGSGRRFWKEMTDHLKHDSNMVDLMRNQTKRVVSDDIRWYQMVSDDIRWFQWCISVVFFKMSVSKMNRTKIPFVWPGTKLCRFYAAGQPCRYGSKCTHSHGPDSGYGSQGSQAAPKEWQSYLLPKDLIWSHLIFFWINQQRYPGPAPHLWYRDVNTLTAWFQLEEMDPIGGKGSKFAPHVSPKKTWVEAIAAIILEFTHPPPPGVFSRFKTQRAKIGQFPVPSNARRLMKWKILRHAMFTSQSWCH